MRLLLLAGSLAFSLAAAGADPDAPEVPPPAAATPPASTAAPPASEAAKKPQSTPPAEAKPKVDPKKAAQDKRALAETYFKQCMQDWDAATHMTKKEWQSTCRRVADERAKFGVEERGN